VSINSYERELRTEHARMTALAVDLRRQIRSIHVGNSNNVSGRELVTRLEVTERRLAELRFKLGMREPGPPLYLDTPPKKAAPAPTVRRSLPTGTITRDFMDARNHRR
jgi:hypothetical protein